MTIYDTARDLKLPGAVVSAHIDPTKVSPRIKKMVQTMLRKGKLKGGWSSQSLMLARKLLDGKNIPVLQGWNSYYRAEPFNAETLAFFDEMFEADASLEKIRMSDSQRESKWYIERDFIPGKAGAAMECGGYRCACVLVDKNGDEVTL
jgi:hypothetical protein